jgi:general secretion pathway protein C
MIAYYTRASRALDTPMEAAYSISRLKEISPQQWVKLGNRYLPPAATAVLVVAIAYVAAQITWTVLPGPPTDAPLPEIATGRLAATGSASTPSLDRLMGSHLFGEAPARDAAEQVVAQGVVDAPDTTLNLQLTGIVSREVSEVGQAIIAGGRGGGESRAYSVGDTIQNADGARLHAVYADRVILNRSGRLEALRLPKELASRAPTRGSPRLAPPPRPVDSSGSLREVITDNASRITDIIRLAPHLEEGQMIGFRINPGRDRDSFTALGLEPGDVITDVNGTTLSDPTAGLTVFEALGEATMANVTVLRNGTPQVLVIDTSQIQDLAENLE